MLSKRSLRQVYSHRLKYCQRGYRAAVLVSRRGGHSGERPLRTRVYSASTRTGCPLGEPTSVARPCLFTINVGSLYSNPIATSKSVDSDGLAYASLVPCGSMATTRQRISVAARRYKSILQPCARRSARSAGAWSARMWRRSARAALGCSAAPPPPARWQSARAPARLPCASRRRIKAAVLLVTALQSEAQKRSRTEVVYRLTMQHFCGQIILNVVSGCRSARARTPRDQCDAAWSALQAVGLQSSPRCAAQVLRG